VNTEPKKGDTGVDEYVNKIQKEQQGNNAIERLAKTKSRTNDIHEYQRYCKYLMKYSSPSMIETAYFKGIIQKKIEQRNDTTTLLRIESLANVMLSLQRSKVHLY
jgi:hypothetical protein